MYYLYIFKQINVLNDKLEEYRREHEKENKGTKDQIAAMEDRLSEVKTSLETLIKDLEILFEHDDSKLIKHAIRTSWTYSHTGQGPSG